MSADTGAAGIVYWRFGTTKKITVFVQAKLKTI
jgi:hypothetical protein